MKSTCDQKSCDEKQWLEVGDAGRMCREKGVEKYIQKQIIKEVHYLMSHNDSGFSN